MPLRLLLDNDTQLDGPWMVRKPGVTEAEFFRLAGEDDRWELIDGDLIMHSPATPEHDDVAAFFIALVRDYADLRDLGKVFGSAATVRLAPGRVVAADVTFLSHAHGAREKRRWIEGAPDWVCEVSSPSTRAYDLGEKLELYKACGVGEVWIVDMVEAHLSASVRHGRRYTDRVVAHGRIESAVLPGFWIDPAWLWKRPLPGGIACLKRILGVERL